MRVKKKALTIPPTKANVKGNKLDRIRLYSLLHYTRKIWRRKAMRTRTRRILFLIALTSIVSNIPTILKVMIGIPPVVLLLLEFDEYNFLLRSGGNEK